MQLGMLRLERHLAWFEFGKLFRVPNLSRQLGLFGCWGIVFLGRMGYHLLGEDRIMKLEIWGDHIQTWAFVLIGCVFVTSGLGICFSHLLRYTKKNKKINPFKLITNCNSETNLDGNLELKANKTYRTELKRSKFIKLNWILTKLKECNM